MSLLDSFIHGDALTQILIEGHNPHALRKLETAGIAADRIVDARQRERLSFAEAVSTMTDMTFPEYRDMMNNGGRSPQGNRSIKGGY